MARRRPVPTFQEIHRARRAASFVGRTEEVSTFEENLRFRVDDPRRRFIFAIDGQGGMGKTTLLNRFRDLATSERLLVGWADEAQQDAVAVMRAWAEQLSAGGVDFKPFADKEREYRERRHELETDPTLPPDVGDLLGRAVGRTAVVLGRRLPIAGAALDFVDEGQVGDTFGRAASALAQRLGSKSDFAHLRLVSEPLAILTPLFLDPLLENEDSAYAFFMDTFEATGPYVEHWLLDVLAGRYGSLPSNLRLCIAGRDALDSNLWGEYEDITFRASLAPLSTPDAEDYVRRQGISSRKVIDLMLELSGRMPLLLATLAAQSPDDDAELAGATDTAVERFLKWIDDAQDRQLALDAALLRFLDEDVVAVLSASSERAFQWLKSLPFVLERGGRRIYHPTVREQMVRQQRRESPARWTELHEKLAQHYEAKRIGALAADDPVKARSFAVELTYHRVAANGRATDDDLSRWARLTRWRPVIRSLAEAISQAEGETGGMQSPRWGKRLLQAAVSSESEPESLVRVVDAILKHCGGRLDQKSHASVLVARGVFLASRDSWEPALADLNRAQAIDYRATTALVAAQAHYMLRDFASALSVLSDVLSSDDLTGESRASALGLQAGAHEAAGNLAGAAASLDECIETGFAPKALQVARAAISARLEGVEVAIAALDKLRTSDPTLAHRTHHVAADVLFEHNRFSDAERALWAAIRSKPSCIGCWVTLGECLTEAGCTEEQMRSSISSVASSIDADSADVLLGRGAALEAAQLRVDAIAAFSAVLQADPGNANAAAHRGNLRRLDGDVDGCIADMSLAISLSPEWYWPRMRRGLAYQVADRELEALEDLTIALRLEDCDAVAFWYRAKLHATLGRAHSALEDLDNYIRQQPDDPDGPTLRAQVWSSLDRYDKAVDDVDMALALSTEHRQILLPERGLWLSYLGRFDEAIADLREAPETPESAYNLAVASICAQTAEAAEDTARAKEVLEESRATNPHVWAYGRAGLAALAGDEAVAIDTFLIAAEDSDSPLDWVMHDMAWDKLRSTGKFAIALDRARIIRDARNSETSAATE